MRFPEVIYVESSSIVKKNGDGQKNGNDLNREGQENVSDSGHKERLVTQHKNDSRIIS